MRRLIAALPFLFAAGIALAGSSTLTVLDGTGAQQKLGVTTDGAGSLYNNQVIVDPTTPATKATVTAGNALKVDNSAVTQPDNVTQFGGSAVVTGTGASGSGIPRVTVSNDSTVILGAGSAAVGTVTLGAGSATIGALTANQSVNAAQIAGSAWSTAASGIPKVGVTDGSGTALTSTGSALDVNLKTSAATVNTGTHTLTSSVYAAGTNGFTTAPFSVLTTEMNAQAASGAGSVVVSSVNGTSGKFNQTSTGNAIFGRCWLTSGGIFTPTAGGNLSIWFLTSTDGGTTFELNPSSSVPPPRAPDIIIPLTAAAYAANNVVMSPPRQNLWAETVKIVLQNNAGAALPATGNVITCGPEATQS